MDQHQLISNALGMMLKAKHWVLVVRKPDADGEPGQIVMEYSDIDTVVRLFDLGREIYDGVADEEE